ncbi:MAG TPA: (Fe-S)-binding protein [Polyangiaceae bacterium]|jgi:Fe-S oxidoreductase
MTARHLSLVQSRARELELCGYCPKLCRATCPVSNVEANEALIPWGKMSLAWFSARADSNADAETAATAWACTGCHACTAYCEHGNPVADTLYDARAEYHASERAPERVAESVRRHGLRSAEIGARLHEFASEPGVDPDAPVALLIGCAYLRQAEPEARAILRATIALAGPVRLVPGCCGAPLLHAGDRAGFEAARSRLRAAVDGRELVLGDPGCYVALGDLRFTTLVALAARHAQRLSQLAGVAQGEPVRFHDPCALGRGLGQYDEPRQILAQVLGRTNQEFPRCREQAECSGAGALLPLAMPETSARIAAQRVASHERAGGGLLVTACASSLRRFRKQGVPAIDIATLIAQGLGLTE